MFPCHLIDGSCIQLMAAPGIVLLSFEQIIIWNTITPSVHELVICWSTVPDDRFPAIEAWSRECGGEVIHHHTRIIAFLRWGSCWQAQQGPLWGSRIVHLPGRVHGMEERVSVGSWLPIPSPGILDSERGTTEDKFTWIEIDWLLIHSSLIPPLNRWMSHDVIDRQHNYRLKTFFPG